MKALHLTDAEREQRAAWALEVDRAVARRRARPDGRVGVENVGLRGEVECRRNRPEAPGVDELRQLIRATQARQQKAEVRRAA